MDGIAVDPKSIKALSRLLGTLNWADEIEVTIRQSELEGKAVPVADVTWFHQRDAPEGITETYLLVNGSAARLQ